MISKWYDKKAAVLQSRKKGLSFRELEEKFGVPRSTLSGWCKEVSLSPSNEERLQKKWRKGLRKGRIGAVRWHNTQKQIRIDAAKKSAVDVLERIDLTDKNVLETLLAFLYLGEGFKTTSTGIGNSNPLILQFFVSMLRNVYEIPAKKLRCELHLRADQDGEKMKKYWSKSLGIPIKNFTSPHFDKRTIGFPTYPQYKGVCLVRCGNIAIQRKLVYLSEIACKQIVGRLAHLVERVVDVDEVTGSSPVPPTHDRRYA